MFNSLICDALKYTHKNKADKKSPRGNPVRAIHIVFVPQYKKLAFKGFTY